MLQPIGLIFLSLGAFSFYRRPELALGLLVISTVFGTAAAVNAGGSSLMVFHIAALVLGVRVALWAGIMGLIRPLVRTSAGVFLLLLFIYAILSGYFMPRLFSGATNTVAITEATSGVRIIQFLPLVPTGSNTTQSIYLILGVGTFCSVAVCLRRTMDYGMMITLLSIAAGMHLVASLLDLLTYYTSTAAILAPVRNADYAYLCGVEKGGLKRMCGFMSEASSYASYTLVLFAIFLNLWIDRIRTNITGLLAAGLFIGVMISTSGSGYVGFAIFMAVLVIGRSLRVFGGLPFRRAAELVIALFLAICIAVFAIAMVPAISETLSSFLEETVFGKLDSASGRERTLWNQTALQNFYDTNMLGAGLGSARASSIAVVLLAQVGIPGTALFILHIASLLTGKLEAGLTREAQALVTAARWAVVAHLIVAILVKGDFVFPLLFYILCGTAAAGLMTFGTVSRERALLAEQRRLQASEAVQG